MFPVGPSALGYRTPWLAGGHSPRGAANLNRRTCPKGLRAMRKFMEIWSNLVKFMEIFGQVMSNLGLKPET